jgi:hypothetical protein
MKYVPFVLIILYSQMTFAQFDTDVRTDQATGERTITIDDFQTQHNLWDRTGSFTQQPLLYSELDISSYDLLSANLSFTDKDQVQKVVIAPFKIGNVTRSPFLSNTKINIALKEKITTIGIGFGNDNSSPFSKKSKKFREAIDAIEIPDPPGEGSAEAVLAFMSAFEKNTLLPALITYDSMRLRDVFKYSFGYNVQLFPTIFANGDVNGFDSLNHYGLKSHNISMACTYSHNSNQFILTGTYNQIFARTTAVEGQLFVPYYGPAVTASVRLFKFLSYGKLRKMSFFIKSRFIPSLNLGAAWEGKFADGSSKYMPYYQDNIKEISTVTPFLDILITPSAQFRLSFPITSNSYVDGKSTSSLGANIQYNFKLSNLAN